MNQPSCTRGQELIESIADWLWEVDERCVYTYSSPQITTLLGYRPEEVIGRKPFEFMPPDEARRVLEVFTPIAAARLPLVQLENVNIHKDGHLVVLETSGHPIIDAEGQFRGYRGIDRDITARKQVEQALRDSEQRYRALVEASPDGIVIVQDGWIVFANAAAAHVTGVRDAFALIGRTMLEFVHEDDRSAIAERAVRVQSGLETIPLRETRLRRADRSVAEIEAGATPIMHSGRAAVQIILRDISERLRTQVKLRETQEFIDRVTTASPSIIYVFDVIERRMLYANRSALADVGYGPEEIEAMGDQFTRLMHPDDAARLDALLRRWNFARDGEVLEAEYRLRDVRGAWRWFLGRDTVFKRDADGRVRQIIGSAQDITDRQEALLALRESQALHRSVVSSLAEGVVIMDADGKIVACNRAAEHILGASEAEIIGSPVDATRWECFRPDGSLLPSEEFPAVITNRSGNPCRDVVIGVKRGTSEIAWISVNTQPLESRTDNPPFPVVASFHDVTERRRSDERQRLLMRELDHRVKNNLAAVLSISAQTLASSTTLEEFRRAFTARVEAMARAHETLARARWDSVDMEEVGRSILGSFADDTAHRVTLTGDPVRLPAAAATPLGLTLHELFTNAVKHGALSTPHGRVELKWRLAEDGVALDWQERDGPAINDAPRPGVGSQLIDGLIRFELRGTVETNFPPDGARVRIHIPLAPRKSQGPVG